MAAGVVKEDGSLRRRKRKRIFGTKKLKRTEKVEVKAEEDGFEGSWHQGTVIACFRQLRRVRYDHMLTDDGSEKILVDVEVSPAISGNACSSAEESNRRSNIRPVPPPLQFTRHDLTYGLCVDVYYKEAWWEGIIFDHREQLDIRRIFFPELGDEMNAGIATVRITQDWDEFRGTWKRRGRWLFVVAIEDISQDWFIPLSLRQIWYDLRGKSGFQSVGNWARGNAAMWRKLTLEVIKDALGITLEHMFHELDFPQTSAQECSPLLESGNRDMVGQPVDTTEMNPNSTGNEPCLNKSEMNQLICVPEDIGNPTSEGVAMSLQPLSVLQTDISSPILSVPFNEGPYSSCSPRAEMESTPLVPVGLDVVPVKPCPDVILRYAFRYNLYSGDECQQPDGVKWCREALIQNVRKHLRHLGWRIEFTGFPKIRVRYISPQGKCYQSLQKICQHLLKSDTGSLFVDDEGNQQRLLALPDGSPSSSPNHEHYKNNNSEEGLQLVVASSQSHAVAVGRESCSEDVYDSYINKYDEIRKCSVTKREMLIKARKHLSALGWKTKLQTTQKGRNYFSYTSPRGKKYFSVRQAFISSVKECKKDPGNGSAHRTVEKTHAKKQLKRKFVFRKSSSPESQRSLVLSHASSKLLSGENYIPQSRKVVNFSRIRGQTTRKLQGKLSSMERSVKSPAQSTGLQRVGQGKSSTALVKYKKNMNGNRPVRALRSRKRVQKVVHPTSSHYTPRSVLSWLIDGNVVSPRDKVYYCRKKDRKPMAEGQILHHGIVCMCCEEVYNLSSFEAHAGSTCHRPAANIFLEDGRSLLDCQRQIKSRSRMKHLKPQNCDEFKEKWSQEENDYICSICHYGGELILCDQCPSSFHKDCLGIENIPEGDWFCPSCRCQICGQGKVKKDAENTVDEPIISCGQCERKYHIDCLFRGGIGSNSSLGETWFCGKKCEEIFSGLHELLQNSFEIGVDNLTWRLVKSMKPDVHDADAFDFDVTESYSKLSVAVAVMHECFDPVREPGTRRDLAEDIIFSRGSELNRLNFRGFYTVLLERNEELITVATVRVYGEKVAEVPLIGTRFQYRRQGMCRILMDELEKKLMALGVERLVLPAVPSVLHTWTSSFGFSEMTPSERLNFVDYTFLDFQDTVMCQKLLRKKHSSEFRPQNGPKLGNAGNENVDHDGSSGVSEVCHEAQTDENASVNQEQLENRNQATGDQNKELSLE